MVLQREPWPIGPTYIKIYYTYYKEIHYKVLIHTVMESKKSYNLPSTSLRPESLVVSFKSLRIREPKVEIVHLAWI